MAGCGIADYDSEAKELILEWIQVLPEYRGQKIGQLIVNELLRRMQGIAAFEMCIRDRPGIAMSLGQKNVRRAFHFFQSHLHGIKAPVKNILPPGPAAVPTCPCQANLPGKHRPRNLSLIHIWIEIILMPWKN